MKNDTDNYSKSFSLLSNTVGKFIQEINKQELNNLATDKWTVRDVLCHIVFWHRYYAQQYASLVLGIKPFVFTNKGGSTRNQEGVNSLRHISKEDLLKLLKKANTSLHRSIVIGHVPEMDYTDRKHYRTEDFLDVVIGHINRHTVQVRRAKEVPDIVHQPLIIGTLCHSLLWHPPRTGNPWFPLKGDDIPGE